jgi:hypothetical protein
MKTKRNPQLRASFSAHVDLANLVARYEWQVHAPDDELASRAPFSRLDLCDHKTSPTQTKAEMHGLFVVLGAVEEARQEAEAKFSPVREVFERLYHTRDTIVYAGTVGASWSEWLRNRAWNYYTRAIRQRSDHRVVLVPERFDAERARIELRKEYIDAEQLGLGGPRPGAKTRAGATVNERIAVMLQQDPDRVAWSAERWAAVLAIELKRTVSAAAVKQTDTWKKQIKPARAMLQVEKVGRGR